MEKWEWMEWQRQRQRRSGKEKKREGNASQDQICFNAETPSLVSHRLLLFKIWILCGGRVLSPSALWSYVAINVRNLSRCLASRRFLPFPSRRYGETNKCWLRIASTLNKNSCASRILLYESIRVGISCAYPINLSTSC